MKIKIEWLSDSCDCETCGPSWAEGARVFFDDVKVIEHIPHASCTGGIGHDDITIYKEIIQKILERNGDTLESIDDEFVSLDEVDNYES